MSTIPITACEWRVGPTGSTDEVRIVERRSSSGRLFAVRCQRTGEVANKTGEWEHEPTPSNRDDAFIERTRWTDWEDAAYMAQRMARDVGAPAAVWEALENAVRAALAEGEDEATIKAEVDHVIEATLSCYGDDPTGA